MLLISLYLVEHFIFGLSGGLSVLGCLMALCFYQDIVALVVPNTVKMGAMDHQCFLSSTKAHVNYMNMQLQDKPCEEAAHRNF